MPINFFVQNASSPNSDFDRFSFETSQNVFEVLQNYIDSKKIKVELSSGRLSFLVGQTGLQINLSKSQYFEKKMSEFINEGDLVVMKETVKEGAQMYDEEAFQFADLTKGPIERGFSPNAPDYRTIYKGLNIYGICKCKKCVAYEKTVIVPLKKCKIDFGDNIYDIDLPCPKCENNVKPITCGFYLCKYKIYGKLIENNIVKDLVPINGEAKNKNSSSYYKPDMKHLARYSQLVFDILELY